MIRTGTLAKVGAGWRLDRNLKVVPPHLVIPGREAENMSRVGDDEWNLGCCFARPAESCDQRIKFTLSTDPDERELIREYLFLALNGGHESRSGNMKPLRPGSLRYTELLIRNVLRDVRTSGIALHDVDQPWLDGWLANLRHLSPTSLVHRIMCIRRLAHYAPMLSFRTIEVTPWGSRSAARVAGYRKGRDENVTRRIPEEISAPALRWAMFYVDHGVDDLITRHRVTSIPIDGPRKRTTIKESDRLLEGYLDRLGEAGGRVPVHENGEPEWAEISRGCGLRKSVLIARQDKIFRAMQVCGTERAGAAQRWTTLPGTSTPWRTYLSSQHVRIAFFPALAACYLVIGLLSGMRSEEIATLARGCLRTIRDANGRHVRYEISGYVLKGRRDAGGARHRWVVVEPVARAIAAAIRLQDHMHDQRSPGERLGDDDPLFTPASIRSPGTSGLTSTKAKRYLNLFADECRRLVEEMVATASNSEARSIQSLYLIPDDGEAGAWHWTTRQLRRTLAWYIASQPFGVVAGMLQYGHASIAMFEGYAGSSESGFRAEIEEERRLAQLGDIVEIYEDWKVGIGPGGPMRTKLVAEFMRVRDQLGDLPGSVVSERRRQKMLANTAVTLHPGYINDCFFYADHALCLRGSEPGTAPAFARCQPSKCPNSVIAKRHAPALHACIADAEEMKIGVVLSPIQRHAIDAQIDLYRQLVEQVEP
ncbi:hypothetical protein GCM10007897_42760 [Sphingobium jiangsuense]|uniref:Integrase n=2 Tax=Sphingobium jiangsuense TaxID=870476 RepID=A0A7W6FSN2_9SPHN|nr:hypothetical protein [Sphingobium jiangsuense]GLT02851.1 hypothetical protein GCM10007897_42760 [Sphingobium jiangsuense]